MNDQELKQVDIYTDGGCISNPGGNGGYGVVLLYNNKRKELSGGYANTTNNRMELMAAIKGLEALKEKCRVTIYSDSKYLTEAIEQRWIYGYSYWAVIEKASDKLIGVTGLISEQADDENYVGVGYIYQKSYWGNGYAFEAASACVDYAFNSLHLNEITAQIRPENTASRKVAERLGMCIKKQLIRRYKNKDIPHLLYSRTI